ncbi:MAG: hypothetical protein WBF53_12815 [Litorimonas sp.]
MTTDPTRLTDDAIDRMSADEIDQALLDEKRRRLKAARDAGEGKIEVGLSPELMKQQKLITSFVLTVLGLVFAGIAIVVVISFFGIIAGN